MDSIILKKYSDNKVSNFDTVDINLYCLGLWENGDSS
jgi:hypothetical protein